MEAAAARASPPAPHRAAEALSRLSSRSCRRSSFAYFRKVLGDGVNGGEANVEGVIGVSVGATNRREEEGEKRCFCKIVKKNRSKHKCARFEPMPQYA